MPALTFQNRYGVQAARTPSHIYLLPHPALRPYIAHYTLCLRSDFTAPAETLTLIPDASGCLVFTWLPQGLEGRMYGPTTETVTVQNDLGRCPLRFFVEFRPGGLYPFSGIPQGLLADRVWPLVDTAPELLAAVQNGWCAAADLDEFVRAVDGLLLGWSLTPSPAAAMLDFLRTGRDPAALADYTGYSPRHLSRLFQEGAGMGCKSFVRVLRVNAAVQRIQSRPVSLTRLAQELGYYDQSHFIHDFKSVCGVTPGAYRRALAEFYNEPLKF